MRRHLEISAAAGYSPYKQGVLGGEIPVNVTNTSNPRSPPLKRARSELILDESTADTDDSDDDDESDVELDEEDMIDDGEVDCEPSFYHRIDNERVNIFL